MAANKKFGTRSMPWLIGLGTAVLAFVIGLAIRPPSAGVVAILVVIGLALVGTGVWMGKRR